MLRLGATLTSERIKKGLTVEDVAKATKIRHSFITAIEKSDYSKIPSSAYVQGFVKNYIEFLGLPVKTFLPIFRREFNEKEFLGVLPQSFRKEKISNKNYFLTQTALVIFAVFILLIFYIFFQYKNAFLNPMLSVQLPIENAKTTSLTLTVTGKTDNDTTITVNGVSVSVNSDGTFKKQIIFFPGKETIDITAVNNFGRKTTIIRHIFVSNS